MFIEIRFAWSNSTCEPGPVPSIMKAISSVDPSPAIIPACEYGPAIIPPESLIFIDRLMATLQSALGALNCGETPVEVRPALTS